MTTLGLCQCSAESESDGCDTVCVGIYGIWNDHCCGDSFARVKPPGRSHRGRRVDRSQVSWAREWCKEATGDGGWIGARFRAHASGVVSVAGQAAALGRPNERSGATKPPGQRAHGNGGCGRNQPHETASGPRHSCRCHTPRPRLSPPAVPLPRLSPSMFGRLIRPRLSPSMFGRLMTPRNYLDSAPSGAVSGPMLRSAL